MTNWTNIPVIQLNLVISLSLLSLIFDSSIVFSIPRYSSISFLIEISISGNLVWEMNWSKPFLRCAYHFIVFLRRNSFNTRFVSLQVFGDIVSQNDAAMNLLRLITESTVEDEPNDFKIAILNSLKLLTTGKEEATEVNNERRAWQLKSFLQIRSKLIKRMNSMEARAAIEVHFIYQ